MNPTVGRIVHYQSYGTPKGEYIPLPRAAVITEIHPENVVRLCILNPTGLFFCKADFSENPKPGCWNWPPKV